MPQCVGTQHYVGVVQELNGRKNGRAPQTHKRDRPEIGPDRRIFLIVARQGRYFGRLKFKPNVTTYSTQHRSFSPS
jgi:hypothetical protein